MALQRLGARIHDDQLAAPLGELLEVGGGNRVVFGRVRADHDGDVGVLDLVEGCGDSARAHVFHERRNRGGVAEPRAVIDVVVLEGLPDELLEEVGLFVRTLGRPEAGNGLAAEIGADIAETEGRDLQRLVPGRFTEMGPGIGRIDVQALFRRIFTTDERFCQAVGVVDVVEAEPALYAEPVFVGRARKTVDILDLVVLDLERDLAADTAERTDAFDLAVVILAVTDLRVVEHRGFHEGSGRAGLHAFAAGDTGRRPHRIVEIEDDLGVMAATGHADHVVDLHFATGADAEIAMNAGVQIDPHRHVTVIEERHAVALDLREAAFGDAVGFGHVPEMGGGVVGLFRLVGSQQFDHELAGFLGPFAVGRDDHAVRHRSDAGGDQRPLSFDFDHAGTAIAIGPVAGVGLVAEMRDHEAAAMGGFPDGPAFGDGDAVAVQRECHHGLGRATVGHVSFPPGRF